MKINVTVDLEDLFSYDEFDCSFNEYIRNYIIEEIVRRLKTDNKWNVLVERKINEAINNLLNEGMIK
jgi:hypothetical protein